MSKNIIDKINKAIIREDGKNIRIKTPNGFLICSFSSTRFRKDKYEMEKQIDKAKQIVQTPRKSKKTKFTKTKEEKIEINQALIDKTTKLLGIKKHFKQKTFPCTKMFPTFVLWKPKNNYY